MNDTLLITGANGFLGSALVAASYPGFNPLGLYREAPGRGAVADLIDEAQVKALCNGRPFRTIVHCAGLAHQTRYKSGEETYFAINARATESLARAAARANPQVHFIFLSSVSVYGEEGRLGGSPLDEAAACSPSGAYAASKLAAEKRLQNLVDTGVLKHLDILRLAPVYDGNWHLNLDRRVLGPGKGFFLRFGSGKQRISALARPNLVGFIQHLLAQGPGEGMRIFNVCDARPYTFGALIEALSPLYPHRPVLPCPLGVIWAISRAGGLLFPRNKAWWHGCHGKLARDMVYGVDEMLGTGFWPPYDLEMVFNRNGIG